MILSSYSKHTRECGNVLFLILIAVALFAALSYAVTQSSRSGGGDANSETNLINSAQVTQYPAGVRTSIIRMIVSNNVSADELEFNTPSTFGTCTSSGIYCVFHPSGGAATYALGPSDVADSGSAQAWVFNGENEVNLLGTSDGADDPSATEAEIIAFLPNVKTAICKKINGELGLGTGTPPTETNINVTTQMTNGVGMVSGAAGGTIGGDVAALDGQAFGCFTQGAANYYYHVLIEQ
ncbi:MAG: hypothetical protein L6Q57_04280 [Alphaproteobacteria bacterium]|nr:hypothetical protein [Alphaproteobacteria bacterium]